MSLHQNEQRPDSLGDISQVQPLSHAAIRGGNLYDLLRSAHDCVDFKSASTTHPFCVLVDRWPALGSKNVAGTYSREETR